jgi:hypothetical protein
MPEPNRETQSAEKAPGPRTLADLVDDEKLPGDGKAPDKTSGATSKVERTNRRQKGPASGTTQFLCELPLQQFVVNLPRKPVLTGMTPGRRFDNGAALSVNNRQTPHGIFAPPLENGVSILAFLLGRKAKLLSFEVGIDDTSGGILVTQPVFQVLGDNKILWESSAIRGKGYTEKCENLSVDGVRTLVLRVNCPGKRDGTGTVWFEPTVTWK